MNLVLVTGPPGSGKTAVAEPLSEHLGYPLMAKDAIKEALDDAIHPASRDGDWSRIVGAATFEAMWALAPYFPDVVLECNFRPRSREQRELLLQLNCHPVEVYCRCPLDVAKQRYDARGPSRHPVHVAQTISMELLREFDRPINLGPVIEVDTTRPVDTLSLATDVRLYLAPG
jgi:predicted kinase